MCLLALAACQIQLQAKPSFACDNTAGRDHNKTRSLSLPPLPPFNSSFSPTQHPHFHGRVHFYCTCAHSTIQLGCIINAYYVRSDVPGQVRVERFEIKLIRQSSLRASPSTFSPSAKTRPTNPQRLVPRLSELHAVENGGGK